MIIDKIENISLYEKIIPELKEIQKEIKNIKEFKVGKYEIDCGFIMMQEGITKNILEGDFETHNKYIDIQILIEGSEILVWNEKSDLFEKQIYNQEKDVTYFKNGSYENNIKITPGIFYICFPQDGHKAVRHLKTPTRYKKIVIKLLNKGEK
jgi:biofilm protein TabA